MRLQLPTDRLILEALTDGRNVSANIAPRINRNRNTVNARARQLDDYGLLRNIGSGVYELTEKGRIALTHMDEYENGSQFRELVHAELRDES